MSYQNSNLLFEKTCVLVISATDGLVETNSCRQVVGNWRQLSEIAGKLQPNVLHIRLLRVSKLLRVHFSDSDNFIVEDRGIRHRRTLDILE